MLIAAVSEESEVRKIQFTGRSTYILSLPKRWMHEMLRSNTGRINPSQRAAVREVVRMNLVGTEIIADASDLITIQILISIPELLVNTAVRRMFLISTAMHSDAIASLGEHNHELARTIIKSDDEVDRFGLYILNLVIATQNERIVQEIGLRNRSDCLSYRVAVRSIERVADDAAGIADKSLKITARVPKELFQKIDKMSKLSITLLTDAVEALLRRDYYLADSIVGKVDAIRSLENVTILFLDKEKNSATMTDHESAIVNLKLILEDIRRTAEHASDVAEAAMNQTISEVIEKHGFKNK